MVEIIMADGGYITIELYPDVAPITVENFKKLVSEGFYDGLIFHRVIADFMIQGGDPTGTGMGGSEENIKGEFLKNGVNNTLSHQRGVISMARSNDPDSASSQFFICHADSTYLDGSYAAFGKVIAGMETVDRIATVQTDASDRPIKEQKIKTIRFVEE
ncbi:MAG: peptidylprolyl isomerase [Clostridia bacterium]|nr:peptidylprolyl isomerase [Clostridia bacterium]